MKRYKVISPIFHDGVKYPPGADIYVDDLIASRLFKAESIEAINSVDSVSSIITKEPEQPINKPSNETDELIDKLVDIIATLPKHNKMYWLASGVPKKSALQNALGDKITISQRDKAWNEYKQKYPVSSVVSQFAFLCKHISVSNTMSYVTPTELLFFGDVEMAQRAFARPATPDGPLLRATIEETDRSAWTIEEQAAGDAALLRMQTACDLASGIADRYLGSVAGALPVPVPTPSALTPPVLDIARWLLYDDKATDEVRYRYEQAIAWFDLVAKGEILLSYTETNSTGMPQYWTPSREYTHDSLTDYDIIPRNTPTDSTWPQKRTISLFSHY